MLTYQLQDRALRIESEGSLEFPNSVIIEIKLGPPQAFGTSDEPGRLAIRGHTARLLWNANTGRTQIQSKPPLEPLDVEIRTPEQRLSLSGDLLTYKAYCQDLSELHGTLQAFLYIFPSLLNTGFADPPYVQCVQGHVGDTRFRWEHREARGQFTPKTQDEIERHVVDSFKRLDLMEGVTNRRLAAGLHYFHMTSRLNVAGISQWEFMAESILNLSKALEILFGTSRDSVREQLLALGYTDEEIEGDFIPLMILRNHFDVGHPRLAIFKQDQLQVLYRYLTQSEDRFRDLFNRIFHRIAEGTYELNQIEDLRLDSQEQRAFDRLVETMRGRIEPLNDSGAA